MDVSLAGQLAGLSCGAILDLAGLVLAGLFIAPLKPIERR